MIYTESQLRQLSTNRLLNLLRKHRNFSSTTQDATFDKIKEILGNREHVPRKKPATPQKYKPIDYSSRFTTNTNTDQKRWTTLWKEVRQLPTRQKWIRLRTLNKDELEKLLKLSSSCTKDFKTTGMLAREIEERKIPPNIRVLRKQKTDIIDF